LVNTNWAKNQLNYSTSNVLIGSCILLFWHNTIVLAVYVALLQPVRTLTFCIRPKSRNGKLKPNIVAHFWHITIVLAHVHICRSTTASLCPYINTVYVKNRVTTIGTPFWYLKWMSMWLFRKTNWGIVQLYHGENKFCLGEMINITSISS
jgi:hypothetical protein